MSTESGQLEVKDGTIHFECAGRGEPVVFLHGFGLDLRMWEPQFDALQSAFLLIRYDLRGFGRSSLPTDAPYAHEDDLHALLSHLGALPAHVVGLSMGGRMALRFAAGYPRAARSLVLADSALDGQPWSPDWQARWNGMCEAAQGGELADAKRLWLEHPLFNSTRDHPEAASLLTRMVGDYSGWHWHNRDPARAPTPPLANRLGEIRAPCLVVTGAQDIPDFQNVAQHLMQNLPAAQRCILDGAGHMVNLEAPRAFDEALLAFWRGQESGGA